MSYNYTERNGKAAAFAGGYGVLMLEKARIHRAMFRLDQARAFTASDVAEDTGAAIATVRKNLDRDLRAGWIVAEPGTRGVGVGRPEKLYRMTALGRRLTTREVDRAYRALSAVAEPEHEPATLSAGRETLASLTDASLDRPAFLRRLSMAQAELYEAVLVATGPARSSAERLSAIVKSALEEIRSVPEHDQAEWQATRNRILARLGEPEPKAAIRFDQLVGMLQRWREADRPRLEDLLQQITRAVRIVFPKRPAYSVAGQEPLHFAEQPSWRLMDVNRSIPAATREINVNSFTRPPAWREEDKTLAFPPNLLLRAA